jgi:hypothetical protein
MRNSPIVCDTGGHTWEVVMLDFDYWEMDLDGNYGLYETTEETKNKDYKTLYHEHHALLPQDAKRYPLLRPSPSGPHRLGKH